MRVKGPAGQATVQPTGGQPRMTHFGVDGNTFHDGFDTIYDWDPAQQVYKRRNPPPLGPWVYFVFFSDETYKKYEQDPGTLQYILTEEGSYVWNG